MPTLQEQYDAIYQQIEDLKVLIPEHMSKIGGMSVYHRAVMGIPKKDKEKWKERKRLLRLADKIEGKMSFIKLQNIFKDNNIKYNI